MPEIDFDKITDRILAEREASRIKTQEQAARQRQIALSLITSSSQRTSVEPSIFGLLDRFVKWSKDSGIGPIATRQHVIKEAVTEYKHGLLCKIGVWRACGEVVLEPAETTRLSLWPVVKPLQVHWSHQPTYDLAGESSPSGPVEHHTAVAYICAATGRSVDTGLYLYNPTNAPTYSLYGPRYASVTNGKNVPFSIKSNQFFSRTDLHNNPTMVQAFNHLAEPDQVYNWVAELAIDNKLDPKTF